MCWQRGMAHQVMMGIKLGAQKFFNVVMKMIYGSFLVTSAYRNASVHMQDRSVKMQLPNTLSVMGVFIMLWFYQLKCS